ncbi:MAG: hypothetical protein ACRDNF_04710 [Streptosporangiaceae bacterium]
MGVSRTYVTRTLFLLSALLGAVGTEGGTFPSAWNKYVPRPIHTPPHPGVWQDLSWPLEFPLAQNELSFLLPHFLKDGRGRLDTYFIRVYNPVWTNPDGLSWLEVLTDESKVGCFVALTPTWNESAYYADYVLPMGHGSERHDTEWWIELSWRIDPDGSLGIRRYHESAARPVTPDGTSRPHWLMRPLKPARHTYQLPTTTTTTSPASNTNTSP